MTDPTRAWLDTALARLDLLLHREILRLRARYELSLDEFRGLYVSDEQVDALVAQRATAPEAAGPDAAAALSARADALREAAARQLPDPHPWRRIVAEYALTAIEQDLVLLVLAPEFDAKYETLYAYLHNDVTRKSATLDLALRVLAGEGEAKVRAALLPQATLRASGLVRERSGGEPRATRTQALAASPGLADFVLGLPLQDGALEGVTRLDRFDDGDRSRDEQAGELAAACGRVAGPFALLLVGRRGSGRGTLARRVAAALDRPLLRLDLDAARAHDAQVLTAARLQQRLEGAVLAVERAECLFDADGRPTSDASAWTARLFGRDGPVMFLLPPGLAVRQLFAGVDMLEHELPLPPGPERRRVWAAALDTLGVTVPAAVAGDLADRFALTPGQIHEAARAAARAGARDAADLFAAARHQSSHELARLAQPVALRHDWRDLVLPEPALARLRDIAAAVRHRADVYERWDFASRVGAALGVKALFAGPSGTGKTMAAGVLARDLGLDLFRIDLSAVVSKYIGETEKALDRIFRAAAGGVRGGPSNAVILFDEADALFGKRSDVKDAHDRYANIEVAYLLQKIEDYDGIVLLATNLAHNIDEAFARRLHYVVDFPLPDERLRERLWRGMFPAATPLAQDIDFAFLARQFKLAGGDIRNVALDAAFLAASDGGAIAMRQLILALARQVAKEGRVPSPNEFKQYYALCA